MMSRSTLIAIALLVTQVTVSSQAAPPPSEAPAGFDTPTLVEHPGSKSASNGIAQPPGDTFAQDQKVYETQHDVTTGLGPVFNARSCAECHQNPVSGGASQFTELRIGHRDGNGNFVNPVVPIDDGAATIQGRSILNDRAVVPEAQEHIPVTENIRALRAALNTLGDGFVEAIDDSTLLSIAARQREASGGVSTGRPSGFPSSRPPVRPVSGASGGRISTGASCRSSGMPT